MIMTERQYLAGDYLLTVYMWKPADTNDPNYLWHVVEDEMHAMFKCNAHVFICFKYMEILEKYESVGKLLNPQTLQDIRLLGKYIREIEDNMKKLKMIK